MGWVSTRGGMTGLASSSMTPDMGCTQTIIAAMGIGSKLAFGWASEKFSARKATAISVSLQAIGVALMITPGNTAVMWSGIFVFGLGFGGLGALIVLAVQETFGMREFGSIMGVIQLSSIIAMTGGPWLTGAIHDSRGEYDLGFAIVIGIFVIGIVALTVAKQPDWEAPDKPESDVIKPASQARPETAAGD